MTIHVREILHKDVVDLDMGLDLSEIERLREERKVREESARHQRAIRKAVEGRTREVRNLRLWLIALIVELSAMYVISACGVVG